MLAHPVSLLMRFLHVRQPLLARAVSAQGCLAAFEKAYVRGEILQKMMPVRTQYQRCIGSSSTPTYRQDSCSRMNCGSKSPQYGQVKPPDSDEETGGSGNSSSCMPSKDSALLEGAILPCCSLGLNEVLTVYPVERGPIEIGPPTRAVPLTALSLFCRCLMLGAHRDGYQAPTPLPDLSRQPLAEKETSARSSTMSYAT
jgi:hypothetical protein